MKIGSRFYGRIAGLPIKNPKTIIMELDHFHAIGVDLIAPEIRLEVVSLDIYIGIIEPKYACENVANCVYKMFFFLDLTRQMFRSTF